MEVSQAESTPDSSLVLEGQLRDCYGRVVYSHKTHEKCAEILLGRLGAIKVTQIVLSALTTGGFLAVLFGASHGVTVFAAILSVVLLMLNLYTKDHDLGELAQKHRQAAIELWLIREKYLALLTDLRMGAEAESLIGRREALLEDLHAVYTGAPSTGVRAYRKAQQALQIEEELSFNPREIDVLLPEELRRLGPTAGYDEGST